MKNLIWLVSVFEHEESDMVGFCFVWVSVFEHEESDIVGFCFVWVSFFEHKESDMVITFQSFIVQKFTFKY